ncbi:TlpA disulfide reductase family protein [Micromonospora sp. WMMD1120]|uniref:TlpA family protein disulfide reductase n=1 Tax=Micromonospora sp. WMMD1120 TaxID=3016106 RepID=UPI00241772C9|nr:TlpA disulfide reductase family protein [Micromonospora sp. WMMD1120]MDG4809404.1 TlpA disulfide reductase family protein [Micromonospora sp. WMMD1120]
MRRRGILPLVLAAALLGGCGTAEPEPAPAPVGGAAALPGPVPADLALRPAPGTAPAAPVFTGALTDGTPLAAAELWAHRPVVLTFFTSWCTTCASRQAALSELARSYRDRVVFVGVAGADQADEVQDYLRAHRVDHPVVLDDQQTIWRSYAVREPPAVVLVAKGGALLRGWPGGLDASALDLRLRELVLAGPR